MSWQTAAHGILTTPAIHDDASLQEPARILFLGDKADKVDKDHPKLSPSQISHLGDKADKADKVSSALSPPRNTHLLTCATGLRSVMRDS